MNIFSDHNLLHCELVLAAEVGPTVCKFVIRRFCVKR